MPANTAAAAATAVEKNSSYRGRAIGISALIALLIWLLYRFIMGKRADTKSITDGASSSRAAPAVAEPDALEHTLSGGAMKDVEKAAEKYDEDYKNRMRQMVAPKAEQNVRPFIGFSLADNIRDGALIVDGVFVQGPAYQVGVDIDHELVSIAGEATVDIEQTRELVGKHCHPGHVTRFGLKDADGEPYDADVWIMTSDADYSGKPYFFDPSKHQVRQSDRLKRTWRPSQDREQLERDIKAVTAELEKERKN